MKTWYSTAINPASTGNYEVMLAAKLNELEGKGHTIFSVDSVSGQVIVVSYITA